MRNSCAITVFPPRTNSSSMLGLAVDIGTTKLAAYLADLSSGNTLAKTSAMNPQIAFGEDVISRIAYTNNHSGIPGTSNDSLSGRKWLQLKVVEAINNMIAEMSSEFNQSGASFSTDQIIDAAIVGNTAMHHIFAELLVSQLGTSPYVPSVSEPLELLARDIGLSYYLACERLLALSNAFKSVMI